MPELPDIAAYIVALRERIEGRPIDRIAIAKPFVLRTAQPPIAEAQGRTVRELRRIGKRIAIGFDGDDWLVLHLMIAGRLHWHDRRGSAPSRTSLAAFEFPHGTLTLTEAGTQAPRLDSRRSRRRGAGRDRIPAGSRCSTAASTSFAPR